MDPKKPKLQTDDKANRPAFLHCTSCNVGRAELLPEHAWPVMMKGEERFVVPIYSCTTCHDELVSDLDVRAIASRVGVEPVFLTGLPVD